MAKEVRLPQLGETMDTGTVVNCLVKVGDEVKKGDIIFEIETDKATLEMESPAGGFVKHILAAVDQTLPVGAPMLVLGGKDEDVPQSFVDSLAGGAQAESQGPAETAPAAKPSGIEPPKPAGRVMMSPRAKKLAEELGVDMAILTGTGPGGKITEQDVQKAAGAKAPRPAAPAATAAEIKAGQTIPLNRLQRITAEKMLKSKREIPCFYLTMKADVTVTIYNILGARVKVLQSGGLEPGRHFVQWEGRNEAGRMTGTGVYFCRMTVAGGPSFTRKMLLIK